MCHLVPLSVFLGKDFVLLVGKDFATCIICFANQRVVYKLGVSQVKDAAGSVKSAAGSAGNKAKDLVGQG